MANDEGHPARGALAGGEYAEGAAKSGPLEYASRRPRWRQRRPWLDDLLALAGFVAAVAVNAVLYSIGDKFALGNGLGPLAKAAVILVIGVVPLAYCGITGRYLNDRRWWVALLPGALVGWGVAALMEGVSIASMVN